MLDGPTRASRTVTVRDGGLFFPLLIIAAVLVGLTIALGVAANDLSGHHANPKSSGGQRRRRDNQKLQESR